MSTTCPTCHGTGQIEDLGFLPGLEEALHRARTGTGPGARDCALCIVIRHTKPGQAKDALEEAVAGRLSGRALHRSLRILGVSVGRDTILNHRNEAHQP